MEIEPVQSQENGLGWKFKCENGPRQKMNRLQHQTIQACAQICLHRQ